MSTDGVRSKGRLRLRSASVADEPDVDFNLLDDPDDLNRMVQSVRLQLDLLRAPEMTSIVDGLMTEVDEANLPGWVRSAAAPAMHPCGTATMGPADADGSVVDQECRVHGVDGLWVVDASVMPEVPRANLNMTVMMLGERVATFLR
jgi:choline dehydrogenase